MPRLSDSMEEGTVVSWLKDDGEEVAEGEALVEIESDKATMAYESPAAGVLRIVAEPGATVPVGAPIARLGEEEPAAGERNEAPAPSATAADASASPAPPARRRNGRPLATPVARRMARVHGIDLATVRGSGPGARVTRSDVEALVGERPEAPAPDAAGPPPVPASGEAVVQPLTRVQQLIARRMTEAKATIPDFQVQAEVDMGAAIALRAELKALGDEVVPSYNDFVVKACGKALRAHPRVNAFYADGAFVLHPDVNVGIAVAADDALVVPTITGADARTLRSIAEEARRLAERVRTGQVSPGELAGATFTVSNLGMFGATAMTPIINPPQAAILGVGATREVPALLGGRLQTRHVMTVTLSCDHRILYGADAARFLSDVRALLEQPLRLLL